MSKFRKIRMVFLAVSISISALIMMSAFAISLANTEYLFVDTFVSQSLDEWSVVDAEDAQDGPSNWVVSNQKGSLVLQQKSNIYKEPSFEGSYVYAGERAWRDYHVNVDINADDNDGMFVLFRYIDDDNFYRFIVDNERDFRRLEKKVAGVYTTLVEDDDNGYERDRWNNIHIKAISNTISVSFRHTNIFTVSDDSLISGKIGLGTYGCEDCYFDNLIVTSDELIDPYADSIVTSTVKTADNSFVDPTRSLGRPRIPYYDFLSVGGPTYSVIYDMGLGEEILDGEGNDLRIYEVGNLFGGLDEEHNVYVSNSPTGPWAYLGQSLAISELDLAGSGLSSARYVRIEDLSSKTNNDLTPGSDIDALQALHLAQEQPITPPANIKTSNIDTNVSIEWSAVDSAIGYNVYAYLEEPGASADLLHSTVVTGTYLVNSVPITTTEYTHIGALNEDLSYAVTSIDPVGIESKFGFREEEKTYLPMISN